MVEHITEERKLKSRFRSEMSDFVGGRGPWDKSIRESLAFVSRLSVEAVVFGGVARDLFLQSSCGDEYDGSIRDIDVVVDDLSFEKMLEELAPYVVRVNRFGGLQVMINNVIIDIWALGRTWAFSEGYFRDVSFETLPKTTFLNVDGIAFEIKASKGKARKIWEHGFRDGFRYGVLDINFEENPCPALCVVRALEVALKYRLRFSSRLAAYLVTCFPHVEKMELQELQRNRYKTVKIDNSAVWECYDRCRFAINHGFSEPVAIFGMKGEQLLLWNESFCSRHDYGSVSRVCDLAR